MKPADCRRRAAFTVVVIYADCVGVAAFNDRLRVLHPTTTTTSHRQSEAQAKAAARVAATVASSWHLRCGVCIGLSNLYSKEDGRGRQRQPQKREEIISEKWNNTSLAEGEKRGRKAERQRGSGSMQQRTWVAFFYRNWRKNLQTFNETQSEREVGREREGGVDGVPSLRHATHLMHCKRRLR